MNSASPYFDNSQYKKASDASLKVLLGPVIGKTTCYSTRILVEFNKAEQVTCVLQASNDTRSLTLTAIPNVPIVFAFDNLQPKTSYRVGLSVPLPVESSSFTTLREDNDNPGNLRTAIVSCNDVSYQYKKSTSKDLWRHIGKQVRAHSLDYVFHIGDQVYMDMADKDKTKHLYGECQKILLATPKENWNSKIPELIKLLRTQYHNTWTQPTEAYVLANVPNLMICDDHEFRDDWGFNPDDYKAGTLDHFYGELVRRLYYEYQRQLREDIPWEDLASMKCEYFHEVLNGVGVSFMEYRGARSWFREHELNKTHIGKAQKEWLESLYKKGGEFEQLNSTIFISPLPLFILNKLNSNVAYHVSDDIQEYWTYRSIPQLVELLELLRAWKERKAGKEIIVVGGDVHLGGITDVMYKGRKIFTQFVSSGISQKEIGVFEKGVFFFLMKFGRVNDDYTFRHHGWTRKNNFGILNVMTDSKGSRMTPTVCVGKEPKSCSG